MLKPRETSLFLGGELRLRLGHFPSPGLWLPEEQLVHGTLAVLRCGARHFKYTEPLNLYKPYEKSLVILALQMRKYKLNGLINFIYISDSDHLSVTCCVSSQAQNCIVS